MILGPLALGAIWVGGTPFAVVVGAAILIGLAEWMRMAAPRPAAGVGLEAPIPVVGFAWPAMAAGMLYLAVAGLALLWLRAQPEIGRGLVFWVFGVVWATDVGGYVAGRSIGGPRLAPRISPGKTWAGLFGGVAAAAILGGGLAWLFGAARPAVGAALGGLLAIVAQAGDLLESAAKRRAGVKDSGHLIPGHGGMLDRIDGLIAAAPAFALFQLALGTRVAWW